MESNNLIAKAETTINAPIDKVWDSLVNPDTIKKYMFGQLLFLIGLKEVK